MDNKDPKYRWWEAFHMFLHKVCLIYFQIQNPGVISFTVKKTSDVEIFFTGFLRHVQRQRVPLNAILTHQASIYLRQTRTVNRISRHNATGFQFAYGKHYLHRCRYPLVLHPLSPSGRCVYSIGASSSTNNRMGISTIEVLDFRLQTQHWFR